MNLLKSIQKKIAVGVFAPNTLRSLQPGTSVLLQNYLGNINLKILPENEVKYLSWLDNHTRKLGKTCEIPWGFARKAMNIFMRDVFYNRYLYAEFCHDKQIETWLEIPVDSFVAKGLYKQYPYLPKWVSIKGLDITDHKEFQKAAQLLAKKEKTSKVHLDLVLYLEKRGEKGI